LTRTRSIPGSILVVAACSHTNALLDDRALAQASLTLERAVDADAAIARVEKREAFDVVLLSPLVRDPVRVSQRLQTLDRMGAVVALAEPEGEPELRRALALAPFLSGDVSLAVVADAEALVEALTAAAERTRARREAAAAERKQRQDTPPPLSARYLGTLLDSAPVGLITLDQGGYVIGWNKRTGEMLEIPEVEALGTPFADLFAAADRARLASLIGGFGTSGLDDEGQVFERGGRSFEVGGARFAIRSGETGSLVIMQDVTKRRAAERQLEIERALMAAQADSSMVGIAVVTLSGVVERVNRRWTEMWGVDAEMIRAAPGRALQIMLDQVVDPDAFGAGVRRLAESDGGEVRDEITLKDGRVIERYATHVRDDAGEVVGRIWFHTDITAHRREEESLRFLADATDLLSSSLDYEATLQRVAELAVPRMADRCLVDIADDHSSVSGDVAAVIESGSSRRTGSTMIVPIKIRGSVFGAITFIGRESGHVYDDDDLQLAEELARRAAIAIENSRVHAELRTTARTLQESLLPPHLPAVGGLELAARFRPAGVGIEVGGDFYDIFESGPDQWAIALGDVCGKGAEAAALTALTRYTVRAAAMYERGAEGVLRVLNEALLRQRTDLRFTTLVYCVLELSGGRAALRVACGGHPRPLLLRADGTTERVGAAGPLLGVLADANFHEQSASLERGDALVFYTDGLTDALAPARIFSEEELLAALADCRGLTAGEIARRLEDVALGGDPRNVPRDDIALVVAKLT
jgi:PAS domain S-box-containing protein